MSVHCKADCRGRPGEEGREQCHPYGVRITTGDGTKLQNMSSQNMRGHSSFNGRGGFWRTTDLKKVQFDSHRVGEDHDAAYRGFAYYWFKGILDNMLCQEQEPPDCDSTFMWILWSKHDSALERFILVWSQLLRKCSMSCQSSPLQVDTGLPIIIVKGYMSMFMYRPGSNLVGDDAALCSADHCSH